MKRNSGAILIMVLGLLMIMSIIVSLFLSEVTQEVQMKTQLSGNDEIRHYAYNALAWVRCNLEQGCSRGDTTITLGDVTKALQCPEHIQVHVKIEDESGKFPLNNAKDARSLQALFSQFGDVWDAKALTVSYLKWLRRKKVYSQIIEKDLSQPDAPKTQAKTTDKKTQKEDAAEPKAQNHEEKTPEQRLSQITFPMGLNAYDQLMEVEHFQNFFFDTKGNPKEAWLKLKANTTLLSQFPININAASKEGIEILSKNFSLDVDRVLEYLGLNQEQPTEKHLYKNLKEINTRGDGHLYFENAVKTKKKPDGSSEKKTEEQSEENDAQNLQHRDCRPFIQVSPHTYHVIIEVKANENSFVLNAVFECSKSLLTQEKKSVRMDEVKKMKNNFSAVELELKALQENIL